MPANPSSRAARATVELAFAGSITLGCGYGSCKLEPGGSAAVRYAATGVTLDDFPDGALATLQTRDGYQANFNAAKP